LCWIESEQRKVEKRVKSVTLSWIAKAENEFAIAGTLRRAKHPPLYGHTYFWAMQCAESYLKARLIEAGIPVNRARRLPQLLDKAIRAEAVWEFMRERLRDFNFVASDLLYPGMSADKEFMHKTIDICTEVRRLAREALQLKDQAD
jgi:HEPN domain-containing protein